MKRILSQFRRRRPGSALVITLVMIVLISTIIVAYLASVMIEGQSARSFLAEQRANDMATMGLHSAVARLRDGFGPWDNPFGNFTNAAPPFFWSISPGRLTQWSYTGVTPQSNVALFSDPALMPNTAVTTNLVNLNRRKADGTYPIIGGTNAPDLSVKWINVLSDPSQPASKTNQVAGRYAFWIDDECAKVNLNTADGTQKTNRAMSPGAGTPGEVSLETFFTSEAATNLAQVARNSGLSTPRDALKAAGVTTNALADNAFNLTTYNRAPELNIFGEPKIFMTPGFIQTSPSANSAYIGLNAVTQQPYSEIYPTPSQLPGFKASFKTFTSAGVLNMSSPGSLAPWTGAATSRAWPMVFEQAEGRQDYVNSSNFYLACNGGWNFALIAKYLGGVNGMDVPIQWPSLPGVTSAEGFKGKYSLRQLDSIAMQITDLGYKCTFPDGGSSLTSTYTAATATWGYLSKDLVSGIGRFARVNELAVNVTAYPANGSIGDPGYEAPYITMSIAVEWFLPAGFAGLDLLNCNAAATGIATGGKSLVYGRANKFYLNIADTPPPNPAPIIKSPFTTKSLLAPYSTWQDTLLHNDAGIDFLGNPPGTTGTPILDPDQSKAKANHPYAFSSGGDATNGPWVGTGEASTTAIGPVTEMIPLGWNTSATVAAGWVWYPGQYWCTKNKWSATKFQMKPDATSVTISGGLAITSVSTSNRGDVETIPLEAKRAFDIGDNTDEQVWGSGESLADPSVYSRALKAVLPMDMTFSVPTLATGVYKHLQVEDPLVNKFPGDWLADTGSANSIGKMPSGTVADPAKGVSRYYNGVNAAALALPNYDPDSFWLPAIDPTIPRSARFPSIGYLNYLRTGIIPDDESVDFSVQKGTPYRMLSFAPSTETANQKTSKATSQAYPDWAMLDLFTIPSTAKPHGTFGGATSGRINPNGAVIYTTNTETPVPGISRPLPLQALLRGLKVNQSLVPDGSGGSTLAGGSAVDEVAIADAIEAYLRANGPLRLPGEICNVSAIAALRPAQNPTRNDLVRQVVGEMSTQSNTFSVWVAGQSVRKIPGNIAYDQFQTGDSVLAEVRYHFVIERYLDPGKDGVYGSTANPGVDGIVGTWDDLVDANDHPIAPKYLYRVVSSEEIH